MQQFLYRLRPTRLGMLTDQPTEQESTIVAEHFAYLNALTDSGSVLMAGRTLTADVHTFGIAILVAKSFAEAETIMNNDPAVKFGVMHAELFPYRVALWNPNGPPAETADQT